MCVDMMQEATLELDKLHYGEDLAQAWDDVSGGPLRLDLARRAREEETEYCRKMQAYTEVPIFECARETGKQPIGVRLVDVNK